MLSPLLSKTVSKWLRPLGKLDVPNPTTVRLLQLLIIEFLTLRRYQ
jgi:hypothetical protein